MKYKVIFDTNSIRNVESISDFLGGRADLERFAKLAEIVIPELVIEEVKSQKKKHLISKRDSFLSNPFHILRRMDEKGTKEFDIDRWVLELSKIEQIPYTSIKLEDEKRALNFIKKLCIESLPPFDGNSDKGFKDAYILCTILEYLEICKDKHIYFVTKDELLRQAFHKYERIIVVRDYEEFEKLLDDYFRSEYFVNRLKEEVGLDITSSNIKEISLNTEGNWIIQLNHNGGTYFVQVDFASREVIGYTDFDFKSGINDLVSSLNFRSTHSAISAIEDYMQYFSDDDIVNIVVAATENDQIYSIAGDDDVKDFFSTVYLSKPQIISEEVTEKFKQFFQIL